MPLLHNHFSVNTKDALAFIWKVTFVGPWLSFVQPNPIFLSGTFLGAVKDGCKCLLLRNMVFCPVDEMQVQMII